jgi:hypothetical protein
MLLPGPRINTFGATKTAVGFCPLAAQVGRSDENPNAVCRNQRYLSCTSLVFVACESIAGIVDINKKATIEIFHAPTRTGKRGKNSIVAFC